MIEIIPAILPTTYDEIEKNVGIVHTVATTVQVDFVDGVYAPNRTWWFNHKSEGVLEKLLREEVGLPLWDSINYDFDLMVKNPLEHIDTFMALGPSRIIFHAGSLSLSELQTYFEKLPEVTRQMVQFGIALRSADDPKSIAPLIPYLNIIQIMGIKEIGVQGQPFDEATYDYVKEVAALYPDILIAVDGGINVENAGKLAELGVTRFVIGSAIFKSASPTDTIEMFKDLCESKATAQENWK